MKFCTRCRVSLENKEVINKEGGQFCSQDCCNSYFNVFVDWIATARPKEDKTEAQPA